MSEYLSDTELFFAPVSGISGNTLTVSGEEAKHLSRVMRKRIGDALNITDGAGGLYHCVITEISDKAVYAEIQNKQLFMREYPNITIVIPALKSEDRMEFAVEKCVEIGFTHFEIVIFKNSVKKSVRVERFNKIAVAAMKQSLRTFLPEFKVSAFEESLKGEYVNLIQDQHSTKGITAVDIDTKSKYRLISGPEGGLSDKELQNLSGIKISLSPARLRAETAVIAGAVLLSSIVNKSV